MRDRPTDLGPQNAPERAQGPPDPNGTTPSADPANHATWLFQKGNTFGQMRKHHKGRMEKYIQEQTKDGARIVEFFLAVASGQPFLMKQILYLRLTPEQCAVARWHRDARAAEDRQEAAGLHRRQGAVLPHAGGHDGGHALAGRPRIRPGAADRSDPERPDDGLPDGVQEVGAGHRPRLPGRPRHRREGEGPARWFLE